MNSRQAQIKGERLRSPIVLIPFPILEVFRKWTQIHAIKGNSEAK